MKNTVRSILSGVTGVAMMAGGAVDAVKEKAGQAGEAIKNKAEEITGQDLDGDGKVGA